MLSLRPLSLAFLVVERCYSITLDVCRNDNPTETCRIVRSNRREFLIVTRYDPSSCGLNSFMALAFVIGSDASSSSSSSGWKNKSPTTSSTIVGLKMTNYMLSLSLSKKTVNARDFVFLEECSLLLMREQLITGLVFVMLRFVMIFVGLGSERELE